MDLPLFKGVGKDQVSLFLEKQMSDSVITTMATL